MPGITQMIRGKIDEIHVPQIVIFIRRDNIAYQTTAMLG